MTMALVATATGSILQYQGGMDQAEATRAAAGRAAAAKQYEANQAEQNAGQAVAAAQRRASDQERRSRLVASRALAVAAASGGGASDTTIEKVISDIAGEGAYRAGLELYQGEERARQLRMSAESSNYEAANSLIAGEQAASASETKAMGSLISGGGSLFAKYGMGGPGTQAPAPVEDRFAR